MSGAVGSAPSLTRKGRPVFALFNSFARKSSSRMTSTAPFRKNAICSSIVMGNEFKVRKFKVQSRERPPTLNFELSNLELFSYDPPPDDFILAAADERERLRVSLVLFGEDARGERVFGVGVEDGDNALRDDGAAVQSLVNEVDCAAGEADAVLDGLALSIE